MVRVNLIQFTLNRAKTNLAGIMDPEKEVGTDALSAKVTEDDYEFGSENTSYLQLLRQIPISIQIITAGKMFPHMGH